MDITLTDENFVWDHRGHSGYKTQFAMQNQLAFEKFKQFLAAEKFDNVIEIGTADGGFAFFLSDQSDIHGFNFITYDIKATPKSDEYNARNIRAVVRDVFAPESVEEIKAVLATGKTLILCDGGDKIKEFNHFSQFLKSGDFIMAHDYGPSGEWFWKNMKGKYWDWLEIWDDEIKEGLSRVQKYHKIDFSRAAWLCSFKR